MALIVASGPLAGLPDPQSLRTTFETALGALRSGAAVSAWTPGFGGIAEGIFKMGLGEQLGFEYEDGLELDLFQHRYGAIILEWAAGPETVGTPLGRVSDTDEIRRSIDEFADRLAAAQLVVIPGGFSGGDEPDGSAKFVTSFFRNPALTEGVHSLLDDRGGLMLGICNGFQALIKLGLIHAGRIVAPDEASPTLTFNRIGRHHSRIVRTRVVNATSPWLAATTPGEVYSVPISHGEGRLLAQPGLLDELVANGQVATQHVDFAGDPSMHISANPNGSMMAIEGMTSPDGRVLGKMGHSERVGGHLYKNVPGRYEMGLFTSAAKYFDGN